MAKIRKLVADVQEDKIFTLYRDYSAVGGEMKKDFFESQYTFKEDPNRFVFRMTETNGKEGVLGLSYGTFLLSVLMDRYKTEKDFSPEEVKKLENSIIALLKYIEEYGFDISPFGRESVNEELFGWEREDGTGKKRESFVESLTWCMSSFLYAKRLHDKKLIHLDDYIGDITRWIAKCLSILLNSVICKNGEVGYKEGRDDYVGWGPITGCTESSLYFTHSVCETFGDIEDTMLGNEELGVQKDYLFIAQVNEEFAKLPQRKKVKGDVVALFQEVCLCVGKNLYEKHKNQLGKAFFYADGSEVTSVDQIAYSMQSPVLLNQIYVVLSMVYVNYHKVIFEQGDEAYKDFCAMLKNAVDLVYENYVVLHRKGKANVVNREYTTFSEKHPNKKIGQLLASERINVAILETLIIKAKAMIVTYVSQYPEKEIGEVLNILDESRSKEEGWIWSNIGYDLQHTERSISAIREFYDYYEGFQETSAKKQVTEIAELEKVYEEKYTRQEESLRAAKLNYEKQLEEDRLKNKRKLEDGIKEEKEKHKLEDLIRDMVKEEVADAFVKLFVDSLNEIAEDNSVAKDTLSEEQKMIKTAIEKMVLSYFIPFNFPTNRSEDIKEKWDHGVFVSAMKDDAEFFVKEWMRQMCMQNSKDEGLKTPVLRELFRDTQKKD